MNKQTEAMKLALDALVEHEGNSTLGEEGVERYIKAVDALREALAEQGPVTVQEPVAWLFQHEETGSMQCVDAQQVEWGFEKNNPRWQKVAPLYTTPQAHLTGVAKCIRLNRSFCLADAGED